MIYVNARFLTQPVTGVQRFAIELLKKLLEKRQDIILLVPSCQIFNKDLFNKYDCIEVIEGGNGHYWEQITLPGFLRSKGSPLLLNLCNTAPVFYDNKISTIHDITFLRYPESYSLKFRLFYKLLIPSIIRSSKKIITVSEFSKKDLCSMYNLDPKDISVVYNAVSEIFVSKESKESKESYALAVSSPNKHKNFSRMIDAFLQSNASLNLKIIGTLSNSFNNSEIEKYKNPRIHFLGRVSDDELVTLYQNANFFIFPSLYEGFGIPPLEAQACGCSVISSNAASLPEVLNNSALFFNPTDTNDIRHAIERISSDRALQKNLVIQGNKNLERFSWNKSAIHLNDIIENVITK